jgi:hypothetical protein
MIKKQTEKQKPTKKLQKRLKKLPQKNPTENSRQRPVMHFASPVSEQVSIEAGKKKTFANRRCFERKEQNSPT